MNKKKKNKKKKNKKNKKKKNKKNKNENKRGIVLSFAPPICPCRSRRGTGVAAPVNNREIVFCALLLLP